jgi:rRNA maturation RNase YbeY
MENEKNLHGHHFFLNFFYEGQYSAEYEIWLLALIQSLEEFIKNDLKIDKEFVLNLNECSESEIQRINHEQRGLNKPTDVLSFPMQESLREGEYDDFLPEIELGDLFICKEVCHRQANEFELSYLEEFVHLAVHGFLHLCGYDHEISLEEEKLMEAMEEKILKRLSEIKKEA